MKFYNVITLLVTVLFSISSAQVCTIEDIFVTTTLNGINTKLTLHNNSNAKVNGFIHQIIDTNDKKLFKEIGPVKFNIDPNQTINLEISSNDLKPKLWWPEAPYLYGIETRVSIENKDYVLDARKLGFKTFEINGSHFYLNGKPYYLRGLSQTPNGRVYDSNGKKAPFVGDDEKFVERFCAKLKELNINAARIGDDDLWVKYADEMGILNVAGSYSGAGATDPKIFDANRKKFSPAIKKLRNHASTAIYTLSNEIKWERNRSFLPLAEENYKFAKELDPTKPIIGNAGFGQGKASDIEDRHDYRGWYSNNITSFDDYETGYYLVGQGTNEPITYTECVGAYTGMIGTGFQTNSNKSLSSALRTVGQGEDFKDDSLWYQAILTKELTEGMRRARGMNNRNCGSFPFSDYWYWDVPRKDFKAKPAVETLKSAYSPILLSLHCWSRHAFAQDKLKGIIYIVNDDVITGDINNVVVSVSLLQNGKLLAEQTFKTDKVKYYETAKIPMEFKIPKNVSAGPATVILKLKQPAANCCQNEMEIFVAPRSWVKSEQEHKFVLFDPKGETGLIFKEMGIKFQHSNLSESPDINTPLVIGLDAIDSSLSAKSEMLWRFVENGGRVLVFAQHKPDGFSILPKNISLIKYNELFVNVERKMLSKDLRHRDFFLWNAVDSNSDDSFPVKFPFYIEPNSLESSAILANCGHHLQFPVVIEYFKGKGSIIYSQLECVSRAKTDPIAAKVLNNLLDYLASNKHEFAPEVGWEIRFADFATENGIFAAPLKQGISINSNNHGKVSYKTHEKPDGRRITGELKPFRKGFTEDDIPSKKKFVVQSIGYVAPVHVNEIAKGFFFFKPPKDANGFTLTVKNPVEKTLWFQIYINNEKVGEKNIIEPKTTKEVPFKLPSTSNRGIKITLEVPIDVETLGVGENGLSEKGNRKEIAEELVFTKMKFMK